MILHHLVHLVGRTDQDEQLFRARDRRIQQTAVAETVSALGQHKDHGFKFASLTFMHRDGIGELKLIELIAEG